MSKREQVGEAWAVRVGEDWVRVDYASAEYHLASRPVRCLWSVPPYLAWARKMFGPEARLVRVRFYRRVR